MIVKWQLERIKYLESDSVAMSSLQEDTEFKKEEKVIQICGTGNRGFVFLSVSHHFKVGHTILELDYMTQYV